MDINEKIENETVLGYCNRIVIKQNIFRKVLDIDFIDKWNKLQPKDIDFINHLLQKISKCKNFLYHNFEYSSFKGCHITLYCSINCDICRLCYDDEKHFSYDMNRPEYARNIKFNSKEKIVIDKVK